MPLAEHRYFDPAHRNEATALYKEIKNLPLICPHGHVDPRLFADPDYDFGTPTEMIVQPDHYVFRMLYSQGIDLETLGIPPTDGSLVNTDQRDIWQTFSEHFYLFRGTPTGIWLQYEFEKIFGIEDKLTGDTAQHFYNRIAAALQTPKFKPRTLYEDFNVEVLCTTDAATDPLKHHQAIRDSGWHGRIIPTFRPDKVLNIDSPGWRDEIDLLSDVSEMPVHDYNSFVKALENRRSFFKSMGATATDHAALTAYTTELTPDEANAIFVRAMRGEADANDATRFTGHMLMEMARMSVEDGLVMQFHVGSYRNHNRPLFERFGSDKGADIPIQTEYTQSLMPLLNKFGSDPRFRLILFTLDETNNSRELAPLAGHYPALLLGPPWWFHDSLNGIARFFNQVMETTGIYNTAGFNDDTRAFPSIPARHDMWRRAACDWLASLLVRGIVDESDAQAMARDLAYNLAKRAYKL